ncbi:MAG: hypothetical protein K8U03_04825 [Planctomycetia bacterium]|nr:hypothetical protein [Planctomycetia bacterium]
MSFTRRILFVIACTLLSSATFAADEAKPAAPLAGQRVFSAGHSFHVFVPKLLAEIAESAKVDGHKFVGLQPIGGSRVIQHWDLVDNAKSKNTLKPALASGEVDVFTISPIYLPDPGIELVAAEALKHNPNVRVTLQEFWLPYDNVEAWKSRPKTVDHDAKTIAELRAAHAPYFASMDEHVIEINKKLGKQVLFVVPVGQAVLGLREKVIAGEAPGIKTQSALFSDPLGHVHVPIMVLNAYCHFAVIYRTSPVGLPVPKMLANWANAEELNKLLQQLAWDAAKAHPLSGVAQAAGSK